MRKRQAFYKNLIYGGGYFAQLNEEIFRFLWYFIQDSV
jgi:hypothetical protein